MGSIRLTAVAVENLAPPEGKRQDVYDSDVPGLVLRLLPTGTKSWSFTYRHQGKARRLSLGVYPGVNLKLARERAREARGAVQRGEDPVGDKKEQERDARMNGFESCALDFIEKYAKRRQRTWKQTEGLIKRFAIKEWGDRPVKEIRRRDVVDLLDKVALTTPYQANHLRAYLSRLFKWLIEREVVEVSPVIGVSPRIKPNPRSRVLSDAELRALWLATGQEGGIFGAATRFLMTTGVRRNEACYLRWDELDGPWACMPASRMKGGRDFRAPLSQMALDVLEDLPRFDGCPYVFTTNGKTPISGWSKAKARIDDAMSEILEEPVTGWRLHDLRRTLASGLAGLGTRSEVIKRVLGHAASSNDVTTFHYNWHNYDAEALDAVNSWADHLNSLMSYDIAEVA